MRRESQISSIPVPRFQSGGGLLNHTCGTYFHSVWLIIRVFRCQNCIWRWSHKNTQGQTCDGSLAPCEAERRRCLRSRSPGLSAVLSPRPSPSHSGHIAVHMSSSIVSKSYITKMRGGGKALETWETKVVKLTETLRDRSPLSCSCCNTLHA